MDDTCTLHPPHSGRLRESTLSVRSPLGMLHAPIRLLLWGLGMTHDDKVREAAAYIAKRRHEYGEARDDSFAAEIYKIISTLSTTPPVDPVSDKTAIPDYDRLRAAFHANMLRLMPEKSHSEISAEIDRAIGSNAAQPVKNKQNHVGVVGTMPGTEGFTMAVFEASKVPVGSLLYLAAQMPGKQSPQGEEKKGGA